MNGKRRLVIGRIDRSILIGFWVGLVAYSVAQAGEYKGKISKTFLRIPYAECPNEDLRCHPDAQMSMDSNTKDHGGSMDSRDISGRSSPLYIVAPAEGHITTIYDDYDECGCHDNFAACTNGIAIRHPNGEEFGFIHIAKGSATGLNLKVGDWVNAGDPIAIEGDVGNSCGAGRDPVGGSCMSKAYPSFDPKSAGKCHRHAHWEVRRGLAGENLNPMTCGIPGNLYQSGQQYKARPCDSNACDNVTLAIVNTTFELGMSKVYQATNSLILGTVQVLNGASVVFHAGSKVRLQPGFKAGAGSYFRAEIGPCNTTAP